MHHTAPDINPHRTLGSWQEDRATKENDRNKREREQLKSKEIQKFYHSENWLGIKQIDYPLQSQIYCPAREVTLATVGYLQRQNIRIKNWLSSSH